MSWSRGQSRAPMQPAQVRCGSERAIRTGVWQLSHYSPPTQGASHFHPGLVWLLLLALCWMGTHLFIRSFVHSLTHSSGIPIASLWPDDGSSWETLLLEALLDSHCLPQPPLASPRPPPVQGYDHPGSSLVRELSKGSGPDAETG